MAPVQAQSRSTKTRTPNHCFYLTRRYYQPERQLLRTTVRLRNLPGAQAAYFASAPGALRNMAAACSHPDVILGVGSSALTGGPDRDEVYIKYKVGVAPYAVHSTPYFGSGMDHCTAAQSGIAHPAG